MRSKRFQNMAIPSLFLSALSLISFANALDIISGQQLLGSSFGIPGINQTFDYVIVGGGNAGLAIASRLSENSSNLVAVIEAGSFYELGNGNWSEIPRYVVQWTGKALTDVNPLIDWGFATVPQAGLLGNPPVHYARGKTLGGCTARNNMAYHRGTKDSYKIWADAVGDSSYEWDSFNPLFDKSVTFTPADTSKRLANSTPDHDPATAGAVSGPVSIGYFNYAQSISSWIKRAAAEIGMAPIPGFIGGKLIGSSWNLVTIDPSTQTRDSSETAYLRPSLSRPNLFVYQSTLAKKILFDANKNAVGVLLNTAGKAYQLSASKEVIITGGAFQSPQLLMVSGVGPADTLNKFGIPVIADRPGVGQEMWDHPVTGISRRVNVDGSAVLNTPVKTANAVEEYLNEAAGPLASTGGDILAWEKVPPHIRSTFPNSTLSALSAFPSDWPELEYIARSAYLGATPPDSSDYASIAFVAVAPLSRGNVTISSADMADPPVIDPRWLTHPADQAVAIAGFRRVREMFAQNSMAPVLIGPETLPGNATATDDQILSYIRSTAMTIFHAACTCKMGRANDTMAVVDAKARVYGVQKLRVVDVSAFPVLPPGHPMATVYALAEKISADILAGN
ncbi:GMC oxidoreductase [Glonium stellatum]|uniref:GMC oxidoreductase n=1 Tax=Glonium stellatum TaxID=574774 RepID=A0A8E2JWR7_9PEZI|nr:GMC oxidoreductase [Glonium stellatum]